ncbi:MAG: hypothetical protein HOP20_05615 [Sulfuriferula sp.]|nr:hypothetical protein [Sulfuriferula sp.]
MSLIETLFGGVVAVIVIHWVLGRFNLPNYWRGVLSAAVVSTSILAYSLINELSLDTVSIHLAVFLSTATVMTLLTGAKKEASKKMHWIPKIFVGFFVILFVVDSAFVSISTNGVTTRVASWFLPKAKEHPVYTAFSGVTRHDEHAGAPEAQHLKQLSSLQALGWKIEVTGTNNLIAGQDKTNAITVNLRDKQAQPIVNADVQIQFFRAGNVAAVADSRLDDGGLGHYAGQFSLPHSGSWIMRTTIEAEGKRLEVDRDVMVSKAV